MVAASDGDYLIKANEKSGERVLVIKDSEAKDNVRMYTMKPDGKGRCVSSSCWLKASACLWLCVRARSTRCQAHHIW